MLKYAEILFTCSTLKHAGANIKATKSKWSNKIHEAPLPIPQLNFLNEPLINLMLLNWTRIIWDSFFVLSLHLLFVNASALFSLNLMY